MLNNMPLSRVLVAEALATFILVFFGIGSVHTAVLTLAQAGIWQIAIVWGVAISLAIYATGAISGAHMNPAITIAFTVFRGFPRRRVLPYIAVQLLGAIVAAAVLYGLFHHLIADFEAAHQLTRGLPGSELSGMIYGEYFPNPGLFGAGAESINGVTMLQAMFAECIGTALLGFFVFAVTDARNSGRPRAAALPVMIGVSVSIIISIIAPLTQAGLNPARDFGPRLFAFFAGWGSIAIPGPRGGFFTVYILAPIVGALLGAAIYQFLTHTALNRERTADKHVVKESHMKKPVLILVGGFLGAGKTTLLWQAARRLAQTGKRVGLITNDQAPQLVDTGLLTNAGLTVEEIAGGCFCCKFNDLITAADRLIEKMAPDVLIGEPVGSCTDISATVVQPIKDLFADKFRLAPFSVLVDPYRLEEALDPRMPSPLHASARYILRKQLEEADLIVLNKADQLSAEDLTDLRMRAEEKFPNTPLLTISALNGDNIDAWLDRVQSGAPAGQHIAEVDYDIYAQGEAVLGWLNATISLAAQAPIVWRNFSARMLQVVQQAVLARGGEIAHVKLLLSTDAGQYAGNLTRAGGQVAVHGEMTANPATARLVLNARVEMAPETLHDLVVDALREAAGAEVSYTVEKIDCLSPGRPQPTHRYTGIVE